MDWLDIDIQDEIEIDLRKGPATDAQLEAISNDLGRGVGLDIKGHSSRMTALDRPLNFGRILYYRPGSQVIEVRYHDDAPRDWTIQQAAMALAFADWTESEYDTLPDNLLIDWNIPRVVKGNSPVVLRVDFNEGLRADNYDLLIDSLGVLYRMNMMDDDPEAWDDAFECLNLLEDHYSLHYIHLATQRLNIGAGRRVKAIYNTLFAMQRYSSTDKGGWPTWTDDDMLAAVDYLDAGGTGTTWATNPVRDEPPQLGDLTR